MTGRRTGALAVLVAAVVTLVGCGGGGGRTPPRPNFLVIVTDDQTLGEFQPSVMPRTFRLLVRPGTDFRNFIVTSDLCCPSRASFLTGQYGHNNGVLGDSYGQLGDPGDVLPVWLERAGYATGYVGKFLNGYASRVPARGDAPPGWQHWFGLLEPRHYYDYAIAANGSVRHYGDDPRDYLTRVLTRRATRMTAGLARGTTPFYVQVGEYAPHFNPGHDDPRGVCVHAAAVPDPRDYGLVRGRRAPRTPDYDERDVADKPSFIRGVPRLDPTEARRIDRSYGCAVASLRGVDRSVAALVRVLRRTSALRDTVIVLTSDNGYFFGDHRLTAKQYAYEEGIHLPLVIRTPPALRGRTAVHATRVPAANIDLAPTILGLAGATPCSTPTTCRTLDGRSLVPVLRGRTPAWAKHRALGLELGLRQNTGGAEARLCRYVGARVGRWSYIRGLTVAQPDGDCVRERTQELYDRRRDPYELRNLASVGNRRDRDLVRRLRGEAQRLRRCAGIRGRDPRTPGRPWCG